MWNGVRTKLDENMIEVPVKLYAKCIMALQKLDDIRKIVAYSLDEEESMFAVKAIMRIVQPAKEGDSDG